MKCLAKKKSSALIFIIICLFGNTMDAFKFVIRVSEIYVLQHCSVKSDLRYKILLFIQVTKMLYRVAAILPHTDPGVIRRVSWPPSMKSLSVPSYFLTPFVRRPTQVASLEKELFTATVVEITFHPPSCPSRTEPVLNKFFYWDDWRSYFNRFT